MFKTGLIFGIITVLLLFAATTISAMTVRAVAEPLYTDSTIIAGQPFCISILLNNTDEARHGMGMAYEFYSPDQSITEVSYIPVPGGHGPANSIQVLDGFQSRCTYYFGFETFGDIDDSTDGWDGFLSDSIAMVFSGGADMLPTGLGELPYFRFFFEIEQEGIFCIDSTEICTIIMWYYPWFFEDPSPSFNGPYCWNVEIIDDYVCGDANHDGKVNVLDVSYLIQYLYRGGPLPLPVDAGDVNSSDAIEILDVALLIKYLYRGGQDPRCPY